MNASALEILPPTSGSPMFGALSALAHLTDDQLETQLALLRRGQDVCARVKKALMREGVHYGTIPGTDKPSLLKPGAEVLLSAFQLVADHHPDVTVGDGVTGPNLRVLVRTTVHLADTSGPCVAIGLGEANSWEKKHRRRQAQPECPECGKNTVRKGNSQYGGGYYCDRKGGGCGANWKDGNPVCAVIASKDAGVIDNPDPHDLANTLLKMAKKRALVDATLAATFSSDLFTQDLEDEHPPAPVAPAETSAPSVGPKVDPATRALWVRVKATKGTDKAAEVSKAAALAGYPALTEKNLDNDPNLRIAIADVLDAVPPAEPATTETEPPGPVYEDIGPDGAALMYRLAKFPADHAIRRIVADCAERAGLTVSAVDLNRNLELRTDVADALMAFEPLEPDPSTVDWPNGEEPF